MDEQIVKLASELDFGFIITSLDYTIRKIENYGEYPSYEFKRQQISEAKKVRQGVRNLRDCFKSGKDKTS